jgi:hypothetical protein
VDDVLGVLAEDTSGSSNLIRLSMLWRDLSQKARHDPAATLGLLDILASTNLPDRVKAQRAERYFLDSLTLLKSPAAGGDRWHLVELLLGKLPSRRPSSPTLLALTEFAEELSRQAPAAAVAAIDDLPAHSLAAKAIVRGVAKSLGTKRRLAGVIGTLSAAPTTTVTNLLLYGPEFRRAAMTMDVDASNDWWGTLARSVSLAEPSQLRILRRALVPFIRGTEHAPLIEPLLAGADASVVAGAVRTLWANDRILVNPPIADALVTGLLPEQHSGLRDAVMALGSEEPQLDYVIAATLQANTADLRWLLSEPGLGEPRRLRLLASFLRSLSDSQLGALGRASRPDLTSAARELVRGASGGAQQELMRLLPFVTLPATEALQLMEQFLPSSPTSLGALLLTEVLPSLVAELPLDKFARLRQVLIDERAAGAFQRMGSGRLVRVFFPTGRDAFRDDRQSVIASLISSLPSGNALKDGTLRSIDEVVASFAARSTGKPDTGLVAAWAELFTAAVAMRSSGTAGAAAITLNYALARPAAAVSPLIVVAFPIVHHFAEKPRTIADYVLAPFGFDRARDVRERVVEQFQRSSWPASDLLVSAWMIGAEENVLNSLGRSLRGREYIDAIRRDLRQRQDLDAASRTYLERITSGPPPRKRRKR